MEHSSASVSFQDYHSMIKQAESRWPQGLAVVLLANRGESAYRVDADVNKSIGLELPDSSQE